MPEPPKFHSYLKLFDGQVVHCEENRGRVVEIIRSLGEKTAFLYIPSPSSQLSDLGSYCAITVLPHAILYIGDYQYD